MIPMPLQITSSTYPIVFYFFFFLSPFIGPLIAELDQLDRRGSGASMGSWAVASIISITFIASLVFIQRRCSSWAASYWSVIGVKSASAESGCVNITVIYILPVLFCFHVIFFSIALISLFVGRERAQLATLWIVKTDLDPAFSYRKIRQMILAGEIPDADTDFSDDDSEFQRDAKPVLSRRAGQWIRKRIK